MPKELEKKLKRQARRRFGSTTSKRARRYIYGNEPMKRYLKNKRRHGR